MKTITNTSNTTPRWSKPPVFNLTQLGNAERFVHEHGSTIRYCQPWRQWLVWDGQRWCRDDSFQVHRLAVNTVRSIREQAKKVSDDELRSKIEGHSRRCETNYNLEAIMTLAQKRDGIPVLPSEFDRDGMLLNCSNGTVDLRTGRLRPACRE